MSNTLPARIKPVLASFDPMEDATGLKLTVTGAHSVNDNGYSEIEVFGCKKDPGERCIAYFCSFASLFRFFNAQNSRGC